MREQKKQNVLTAIIVILVIALVMMVGSIIYEEKINISRQPIQNVNTPDIKEDEKVDTEVEENEEDVVLGKEETEDKEIENETESEDLPVEDEEYVGEEEATTEEPKISTDQKVIDLVKKEWGQDNSAIFSIEKKNGNKYRVAVRDSSTTVLAWYEVDTETWKVSEY